MVGSILVVDDDAAVRGLVVRILRSWGHVVIGEAGSVAEALQLRRDACGPTPCWSTSACPTVTGSP